MRSFLALLCLTLVRCAPAPREALIAQPASSSGAMSPADSQALRADAAADAPSVAAEGPLVRAQSSAACPLRFADADVELARANGVSITACDVALLSLAVLREGGAPLSARAALARTLFEATTAIEAQRRPALIDADTRARVDRTLADAVVRDAARAAFVAPDRAEIERYFNQHRSDFDREARVHVRAIAVDSESGARAIVQQLREGAAFERLAVDRSALSGARRDEGDLGLSTIEGSDYVPRAVAQRAFALTEFAAVDPEPVRIETTERVGRRRRPRTRVRWYVVQRLERIDAAPATLEGAARRILFRLGSGSWREALLRQRGEVVTRARAVDSVTIDERALRSVRIRVERSPPRAPTRARRSTRRR